MKHNITLSLDKELIKKGKISCCAFRSVTGK